MRFRRHKKTFQVAQKKWSQTIFRTSQSKLFETFVTVPVHIPMVRNLIYRFNRIQPKTVALYLQYSTKLSVYSLLSCGNQTIAFMVCKMCTTTTKRGKLPSCISHKFYDTCNYSAPYCNYQTIIFLLCEICWENYQTTNISMVLDFLHGYCINIEWSV